MTFMMSNKPHFEGMAISHFRAHLRLVTRRSTGSTDQIIEWRVQQLGAMTSAFTVGGIELLEVDGRIH